MSNFDRSLAYVLKEEGGYSNDPRDPGGATNFGIIQRVYDDYRKRLGLPARAVKLIDESEVKAIYQASYWSLAKCDLLPDGVDYVVFDGAVNSGVGQSAKWLQRALGVKADGIIGPATIAAAEAYPDHDELVDKICDARMAFLKALKTFATFGKGWSARVSRVRARGKTWAAGNNLAPAVSFMAKADDTAKAYASDAAAPPSPAIGDAMTGAGTMGGVLTQTINQLTPMTQIQFVANIVAVLTVASVVLAIGGIGYGIWARRKKAAIKDAVQVAA